jgi:glycosyltransferase involved in cell wall biosynthesis
MGTSTTRDRERAIQHHIISDNPDEDLLERNRFLREQLNALHGELTAVERDRQILANLWTHPFGMKEPTVKGELTYRIKNAGRQVRDLGREVRAGQRNPVRIGKRIAGIGYRSTFGAPIGWARKVRSTQRKLAQSPRAGNRPLTAAERISQVPNGKMWREVLEPSQRENPVFLAAARTLSVRSGDITDTLDITTRLARHQPRYAIAAAEVNGRARELSGWIPRIPGPTVHIEPAAPNRVLHLVKESRPYYSNGFTSRSHENFKAEKLAGLDPVVLTEPGFPRAVVGEGFDPIEEFEGIVHHRLDTGIDYSKVPADRWQEDFAWLAYQKVREIRPAIIHASSGRRGFETALTALALKRKTGIPVVYEVRSFFEANWTSEQEVAETSETYRRRRAVEELCMQEADAVLTLGTAMKDSLVARGVPEDKIGLVPNGVNLENFVPQQVPQALRDRYGITMPTFGYVSNMDHFREGQEYLVEAAAILKDQGVAAQCVLVGGGGRLEEMKALAISLGVEDRVVFTGHIDHSEVSTHYSLIDVFVVPRVHELAATYVTPLKPFEAMAMERPVVASDLPALAEIVCPPERGRLFEPENAQSLAAVVRELIANPALCAELGRAGRAWIENERQWVHNGPRYRDVFEEVIARVSAQRTATSEGA